MQSRKRLLLPNTIKLRQAAVSDGAAMWTLVRESGTLDLNSAYAYLMACQNFADTCLVAEDEGGVLAGMVLAYRLPMAPEALFVWQIGVSHSRRGQGLGVSMLTDLVERSSPPIAFVETTITPSNRPSQALFRAFARHMDAPVTEGAWLPRNVFPDAHQPGAHEAEDLFRIGPFRRNRP